MGVILCNIHLNLSHLHRLQQSWIFVLGTGKVISDTPKVFLYLKSFFYTPKVFFYPKSGQFWSFQRCQKQHNRYKKNQYNLPTKAVLSFSSCLSCRWNLGCHPDSQRPQWEAPARTAEWAAILQTKARWYCAWRRNCPPVYF